MNKQHKNFGFTIVELLVVISIIALLVGILVPAVNKARDTAKMTQSKSNIHQVTIGMSNYSADWSGDHYTTAPHDLASGTRNGMGLMQAINDVSGNAADDSWTPVGIRLGNISVGNASYVVFLNNEEGVAPYLFGGGLTTGDKPGFGTWRYPNALQVAEYMDGLPLHKAYFSPKDKVPLRVLEGCDANNGSYCTSSTGELQWGIPSAWESNMYLAPSSYCISPAMMYNWQVYAWDDDNDVTFVDPMEIQTGFRPSTIDQAQFPNLKSWLMEHYWLQNTEAECSAQLDGTWFTEGAGCWDGCEPYHYNNSYKSSPVTAFADGHVGTFEVAQANRDSIVVGKANGLFDNGAGGLWHSDTSDGADGYYISGRTDWVTWSGHAHTTNGIKGRDVLGK